MAYSTACALALVALVPAAVLAAPPKTPPAAPKAGGKKPPASASASTETSASATASTSAFVPPSSTAPVSSVPVSPLTPRPDEVGPVKGSPSGKPAQSYDELMAEIAALRARVAVVSNAVWKSKLSISFRVRGSHARIAAAKLSLDGAMVWQAPKGFAAEDDTAIFEGGVAPGPHAITIEIERRDDRDETFRTIERTTSTVVVPQNQTLAVQIRLEDDSCMGKDPKDCDYDLRFKLKAVAK